MRSRPGRRHGVPKIPNLDAENPNRCILPRWSSFLVSENAKSGNALKSVLVSENAKSGNALKSVLVSENAKSGNARSSGCVICRAEIGIGI
jgi:hypothetical protein